MRRAAIALFVLVLVGIAPPSLGHIPRAQAAQTVYAIDTPQAPCSLPCGPTYSTLFTLNFTVGGADTELGSTASTPGVLIPTIAEAPDGSLYGTDGTTLYTISIGSVCCTLHAIGSIVLARGDLLTGLAFSSSGQLFGTTAEGNLLTIDPTSAAATVVESFGSQVIFLHGLTVGTDGALYATEQTGSTSQLARFSSDLHSLSLVGNIGTSSVNGLFVGDSGLEGVTSGSSQCGSRSMLVTIDQSTGAGHPVGCLTWPYTDVAAIPVASPPSTATPIPTIPATNTASPTSTSGCPISGNGAQITSHVALDSNDGGESVTLTPASGPPGSSIEVTWTDECSGTQVNGQVLFDGAPVATFVDPSDGGWSGTVTIPVTAAAGDHTILVSDSDGSSGSATFTVVIPPTPTPMSTAAPASSATPSPTMTTTSTPTGTVVPSPTPVGHAIGGGRPSREPGKLSAQERETLLHDEAQRDAYAAKEHLNTESFAATTQGQTAGHWYWASGYRTPGKGWYVSEPTKGYKSCITDHTNLKDKGECVTSVGGFYYQLCGPGSTTVIAHSINAQPVDRFRNIEATDIHGATGFLLDAAFHELSYGPDLRYHQNTWGTYYSDERTLLSQYANKYGSSKSKSGYHVDPCDDKNADCNTSYGAPWGGLSLNNLREDLLIDLSYRHRALMAAVDTSGLPWWGKGGIDHYISIVGWYHVTNARDASKEQVELVDTANDPQEKNHDYIHVMSLQKFYNNALQGGSNFHHIDAFAEKLVIW